MASHIQSSNNWRLNVTMDCMPAIGMCFLWISAKKIQSHMFFTCHYSKQVWFVFFGGWPPAGSSSITCLIGTIYYRLYRQPNIRKFDIYFDTCFFYKNKKLFNHIWREESPNCQSAEESQYTLGQLIK